MPGSALFRSILGVFLLDWVVVVPSPGHWVSRSAVRAQTLRLEGGGGGGSVEEEQDNEYDE